MQFFALNVKRPVSLVSKNDNDEILCQYDFLGTEFRRMKPDMSMNRVGCVAVAVNDNNNVLVFGGYTVTNRCTDVVEELCHINKNTNYNTNHHQQQQLWKQLDRRMPMALFGFAAINLQDRNENDNVYLFGGEDSDGRRQNGCYKYDVNNSVYTIMPPMKIKRSRLASVGMKKKLIFAIGGTDERRISVDTAECFNISTDNGEWIILKAKMNKKRAGCCSVSVGEIFYVIGGIDENRKKLNSIEMYDTSKERKGFLLLDATMQKRRSGATAIALGHYIIIFGGTGNDLSTIEIFNTKTQEFIYNHNKFILFPEFVRDRDKNIVLPKMIKGRSYCSAVLVRNDSKSNDDNSNINSDINRIVTYAAKLMVIGGGYVREARIPTAEVIRIRCMTTPKIANIQNRPSMWSITFDQLMSIHKDLSDQYSSMYENMTMIDVNEMYIKPYCESHGTSMALGYNPNGCKVDAFVTHCWQEPFKEFVESIVKAYNTKLVKPNLWICAFALYQGSEDKIKEQLGSTLQESPFVLALQQANEFLVVRNPVVDLYSRIWCVCEVMEAKKCGLIPDKVHVTGPNTFAQNAGSVRYAKASKEEDRITVMEVLLNEFDVDEIDAFVKKFRQFA